MAGCSGKTRSDHGPGRAFHAARSPRPPAPRPAPSRTGTYALPPVAGEGTTVTQTGGPSLSVAPPPPPKQRAASTPWS